MIVYEPAQEIADWVAAKLGTTAPLVDAAIAYMGEDDIKAAVYFDTMNANNIFAHIASATTTLPRSLLAAVARYVYDQLGIDRMTFSVPESNYRTRAFVRAMGAEVEGRLKNACGDGDDLMLFVLWRHAPFAQQMLSRSA